MADVNTRIKKWGNSYGIIIPQEVMKSKGLKEGEEVGAIIVKKGNVLRDTFGKVKFNKPTEKMMKDMDKELYDI